MKRFTQFICLALMLSTLFIFTACGTPKTTTGAKDSANSTTSTAKSDSTKVKVTMDDRKTFTIKCNPEMAPETCKNFLKLVSEGFYDGLTFHRVLDDFMAQGGDPKGDGTGGSETQIKGEFSSNDFAQNTLKHKRGTVSMARSSAPDSASSQFFICYKDTPHLDGSYAAFGEVTEGMEVVDDFLKIKRDTAGKPEKPITIKKMELID
ncbi:MAG: peptidylprolyl isomerase [Oscillospiraceae bacterium]